MYKRSFVDIGSQVRTVTAGVTGSADKGQNVIPAVHNELVPFTQPVEQFVHSQVVVGNICDFVVQSTLQVAVVGGHGPRDVDWTGERCPDFMQPRRHTSGMSDVLPEILNTTTETHSVACAVSLLSTTV